jgi:hypothetical protein
MSWRWHYAYGDAESGAARMEVRVAGNVYRLTIDRDVVQTNLNQIQVGFTLFRDARYLGSVLLPTTEDGIAWADEQVAKLHPLEAIVQAGRRNPKRKDPLGWVQDNSRSRGKWWKTELGGKTWILHLEPGHPGLQSFVELGYMPQTGWGDRPVWVNIGHSHAHTESGAAAKEWALNLLQERYPLEVLARIGKAAQGNPAKWAPRPSGWKRDYPAFLLPGTQTWWRTERAGHTFWVTFGPQRAVLLREKFPRARMPWHYITETLNPSDISSDAAVLRWAESVLTELYPLEAIARAGRAKTNPADRPRYPLPIGYGTFLIFSKHARGPSDPLYRALTLRGNSVDWVTVRLSESELRRFEEVAYELIRRGTDQEKHVADGFLRTIAEAAQRGIVAAEANPRRRR